MNARRLCGGLLAETARRPQPALERVATARMRRVVMTSTVAVALLVGSALVAPYASASPRSHRLRAAHAHARQKRGRATPPTVWLCRPGTAADPCTADLTTTAVAPDGTRTTQDLADTSSKAFDCFYVYPTVSTEKGANADLRVQLAEIAAAFGQAAPFSQVCQVWAPMYRQTTVGLLLRGFAALTPRHDDVAYDSLLSAWKDFVAHDDDGRPIVFIGHSQGAAVLIRLLRSQIDPNAALRSRTVVAILAGGNLQVPTGKTVGATFRHLPLCTAPAQASCVIAYSSFPSEPPSSSPFGRPGSGVSKQSGQTATTGQQVACVDPASIGGTSGVLAPSFPSGQWPTLSPAAATPWVTFPELYSASCKSADGTTWLQVTDIARTGDTRPVVKESLGPTWGYHLDDINLASGNLVADVAAAEHTWSAHHGSAHHGSAHHGLAHHAASH